MLQHCLINSIHSEDHEIFWRCYEESFPIEERRRLQEHEHCIADEAFTACVLRDARGLVGILSYWIWEGCVYLEHLAIAPERRGQGLGHEVVKCLQQRAPHPIVLEIEPLVDDLTRARARFYESLGFKQSDFPHTQPPYRLGGDPVPLLLMHNGEQEESILACFQRHYARMMQCYVQLQC